MKSITLSECSLKTLRTLINSSESMVRADFGITQQMLKYELDRRKRMSDTVETIILDAQNAIGGHDDYSRALSNMIGWYIEIKPRS